MYIELEHYENANAINQFYLKALKNWKIYGTKKSNINRINIFPMSVELFMKMEINEIAFFFATQNQYIEDAIKENPKYEAKYIEELSKIEVGKHFISKVETNKQQFFYDIRSALAHANYKIFIKPELKDPEDNYIYIENDRVKGKISLGKLIEIKEKYQFIKESIDENEEMLANVNYIMSLKTNNKNNYKNAIDSLKLAKFKDPSTTIGIIMRAIPELSTEYLSIVDVKDLTEKQKRIIKSYIDYVGLKKWNNTSTRAKVVALTLITKFCFNNKVRLQFDTMDLTRSIALGKYYEEKQDGLSILAPFHYANLLMQYSFYCLNTYKERAKQINIEDLLYTSNELSKINYIDVYDCDKDEIENKIIEKLKSEKNKLKIAQENKEKQINGIMSTTKLENDDKISKLKERREELDRISITRKQIDEKLHELTEKQGKYGDYFSSPEFFDRLRNSISHGYYEIDYLSGLKTKNLENMIIRFYDKNDKRIVFDFKIRAADLISLFNTLLVEVKQKSPHYQRKKNYDSVIINESSLKNEKEVKKRSINTIQELINDSNHTLIIHNKQGNEDVVKGRKK